MSTSLQSPPCFIIAVTARALFDLEKDHLVFERQGLEAFLKYQAKHTGKPLSPGPAFSFIKKIMSLNETLPANSPFFDVVLISRNSAETANRIFDSIEHYKLGIQRAIFTSGAPSSGYVGPLGTSLFLSSNPEQVKKVIDSGVGAAVIYPRKKNIDSPFPEIRLAFDGDAVIFSDESERVHCKSDLEGFLAYERKKSKVPLPPGPLKPFLDILHQIQSHFPADSASGCPIRTALITARGLPAHQRAINTLNSWGVRLDEMMFLGGRDKAPFLTSFGADLFFDDSQKNIELAATANIPSGHVPFGARNEPGMSETKFTGGQVSDLPEDSESALAEGASPAVSGARSSSASASPSAKAFPESGGKVVNFRLGR